MINENEVGNLWEDKKQFVELNFRVLVPAVGEIRTHKQWMAEDYNIKEQAFYKLVRGYIFEKAIVMYMGEDFGLVRTDSIQRVLNELVSTEGVLEYDISEYDIYSGVLVGNTGELWFPKIQIRRHTK